MDSVLGINNEDLSNLCNFENYYVYANLIKEGKILIDINSINKETWKYHYNGIMNILRDGIETKYVQSRFISIKFPQTIIDLALTDFYINLLLWYVIVESDQKIEIKHILFEKEITADTVKDYIDTYLIEPNIIKTSNRVMNNIIADTLYNFISVDEFSLYLADTLNMEDDIDLMDACKEYDDLMHCDLSQVPIEKVKDKGLEITKKAIEIIKNSKSILGYNHCLRNAFMAKEGINIRQYKEESFNIGTKPDGQGGVFHARINQSYRGGGVDKLLYQFIDSSSSRVAQIIAKKNVGDSGTFSRILGLNNATTFLHPDPNYDCHSKVYVHITIKNEKELKRFCNRYFKFEPNGILYKIHKNDTHLIGKEILLRSPITCVSHARGKGICYKCYGDLAYVNADINIGKIAAEIIGSQYTQKRLSAKHLLETIVRIIKWYKEFYNYFILDSNEINIQSSLSAKDLSEYNIIININDIQTENDDDEILYNNKFFSNDKHILEDDGPFYDYYITEFYIQTPNGKLEKISSYPTEEFSEAKLYLSNDLMRVIDRYIEKYGVENDDNDNSIVSIPLSELIDSTVFDIKIENNDLGKNLDLFMSIINKAPVTKKYNKDTIIQALVENTIKGGIVVDSIHLETLISNQICSPEDRLKKPNWENPDEPYELLTLNEALTDNPSVIVSLMYQKIAKAISNPINFRKQEPSIYDPLFMRKPKKFLNADHEIWDLPNYKNPKTPKKVPMTIFKKHDNIDDFSFNIPEKLIKDYKLKEPKKTEID